MTLINDANWALIQNAMQNNADTFCNKKASWFKCVNPISQYMESPDSYYYVKIDLLILENYNYLRSWPITKQTESGGIDEQSVQIILNKADAILKGFMDANNNLFYNPEMDRFVIDNVTYKPAGDTFASQEFNSDAIFTMILKRDGITKLTLLENGNYILTAEGNPIKPEPSGDIGISL